MERSEDRPVAKRCAATLRNGSPCRAFAIHGDDFCIFHTSKARQRELKTPKSLTNDEMILLLSQTARKLGRMTGPGALDRARELRIIVSQIDELKSGKAVEDVGKDVQASGITARVEQWKNKNRQ